MEGKSVLWFKYFSKLVEYVLLFDVTTTFLDKATIYCLVEIKERPANNDVSGQYQVLC